MGNCESIKEQDVQAPRQGPVCSMYLKSLSSKISNFVWSKKYLGLYDYEAIEFDKKDYKAEGNAIVFKEKDNVIMMDEKMDKLARGMKEVS